MNARAQGLPGKNRAWNTKYEPNDARLVCALFAVRTLPPVNCSVRNTSKSLGKEPSERVRRERSVSYARHAA